MHMQKTIFVGMSGGVDSSVAAKRLLDAGHNVVGVFIKVWQPDFIVCNWEAERVDAMRVAAHLGIPFLTCDAKDAYKQDVADYFIAEYLNGRTPNPDVMCNQYVKFGAFMKFAKAHGADGIATGHYVQRIDNGDIPQLHRGVDPNKDQSYFLWSLSDEQLAYSYFPVGDSPKSDIRKEAEHAQLPTASKQDSQGVCFLGHIDIPDFLRHYTTLTAGPVLNTGGEIIGEHQGALVYTTGQRHGFTITNKSTVTTPHYVQSRDLTHNTITVAPEKPVQTADTKLHLEELQLRNGCTLAVGDTVSFQTRYRQAPSTGTIEEITSSGLQLLPSTDVDQAASGQSCVLYRGTLCLGGGIIQ